MTLHALYEYYQRMCSDPDNTEMAALGWQWKEIPFVLVLNTEGKLVGIDDFRKGKNRAKAFLLPQEVSRTSGVASNVLWDKPSYIWGYDPKVKPERLRKEREAFMQGIRNLPQSDAGVRAAIAYLSDADSALAQAQAFADEWTVIAEKVPFIALRLDSDLPNCLICNRLAVLEAINAPGKTQGESSICLITGEYAPMARLHDPIKGVLGAQTAGAPLVSFNANADCSYGKKFGDNAPVSEAAAAAYANALNYLLRKDSQQKVQCGATTIVFWARKKEYQDWEVMLSSILAIQDKNDPDLNHTQVRSLLRSPHKGGGAFIGDDHFYLLGLSPNVARLSVRFWLPTTVREIKERLLRYFEEIQLVGGRTEAPALRSLLSSLAFEYKLENLSPLLEGGVIKSIFSGLNFPKTLLSTALQRLRAEQNLPHLRAALIKAFLIRNCHKEISVSLDPDYKDNAYQLGRFFSVLEKTQEDSGDGRTIKTYFGAASMRPATVFPTLIKLHKHHLAKLQKEKPGLGVHREKLITSITGKLSPQFPATFSIQEQGTFAMGYYHQRQDLFTVSDTSEKQAA